MILVTILISFELFRVQMDLTFPIAVKETAFVISNKDVSPFVRLVCLDKTAFVISKYGYLRTMEQIDGI